MNLGMQQPMSLSTLGHFSFRTLRDCKRQWWLTFTTDRNVITKEWFLYTHWRTLLLKWNIWIIMVHYLTILGSDRPLELISGIDHTIMWPTMRRGTTLKFQYITAKEVKNLFLTPFICIAGHILYKWDPTVNQCVRQAYKFSRHCNRVTFDDHLPQNINMGMVVKNTNSTFHKP